MLKRTKVEIPRADFLSHYGAGILAKAIVGYWHRHGAVNVLADRYEMPDMKGVWGVRTNLLNGLPPAKP